MASHVVVLLAVLLAAEEAATRPEALLPAFDPRGMEVTFVDQSVLKLLLVDEAIEIDTPHGRLRVPTDDVRRIEFAQRLPEDVTRRVQELLALLREADDEVHKPAARELIALGDKGYLAVAKAAKSGDPLLAPRAGEVLQRLQAKLSKRQIAPLRSDDLVETVDARIAGRIAMPTLKVHTVQFGELSLRIADAKSARHLALSLPAATEVASEDVQPDPGNLKNYEARLNETFAFRVTGAAAGGSIWGTDVYTTDSMLAMAAVHAGVLKPGETGVVRLKILPSPPSFAGSARNGVTTSPYGPYSGAYEILKDGDLDE
jgi:hypothetical protein